MRASVRGRAVGLVGAAALCLSVPGQAFGGVGAGAPEQGRSAYCGTDRASGLGVSAVGGVDCGTALRVAAGYTEVWREGAASEVQAGGAVWKCQERQGDPNPYQECVDTGDSGRRVMLLS